MKSPSWVGHVCAGAFAGAACAKIAHGHISAAKNKSHFSAFLSSLNVLLPVIGRAKCSRLRCASPAVAFCEPFGYHGGTRIVQLDFALQFYSHGSFALTCRAGRNNLSRLARRTRVARRSS